MTPKISDSNTEHDSASLSLHELWASLLAYLSKKTHIAQWAVVLNDCTPTPLGIKESRILQREPSNSPRVFVGAAPTTARHEPTSESVHRKETKLTLCKLLKEPPQLCVTGARKGKFDTQGLKLDSRRPPREAWRCRRHSWFVRTVVRDPCELERTKLHARTRRVTRALKM